MAVKLFVAVLAVVVAELSERFSITKVVSEGSESISETREELVVDACACCCGVPEVCTTD